MTAYCLKIGRLFLISLLVISPLMLGDFLPQKSLVSYNAGPIEAAPLHRFYQPLSTAATTAKQASAKPSPALQPMILPEAEEPVAEAAHHHYTVAVLGDSMINVMGENLPSLTQALNTFYHQAEFSLLNYGVGATTIEQSLARIPSLIAQNPDIVVIESFAYNHWSNSQADLDRQWLTLAKIIDQIKIQSQAKIVLTATIAPDEQNLCDGIEGLNLSADQKKEKAQTIRAYLQNLTNFATSQGYPLADAYHPSLGANGNGQAIYVNANDHLHPSTAGINLISQRIAEAIYQNNLL
ncbi:hypothetical protein COT66_01390 [Candidatus Shapirobacteria bacterium CG09_land_8_20_14_0_10_49_15]|uniref:SGNH hydrolase-type esterase domain-containing protein n=2 Tax=Candidatus Shapironibacteriota TaxID=1752721 RepID=A0A2M8L7A4_9BACT|nr:MAG: hypothetical protein COT66_01390 [Candidatus Shapirobacteria bacterium CG09_land_8_20_14_0_10_49_15]PJE70114.1 MAG: hypothetical protein COU97_01435 [Candidatus Shapirobacteria bacterium CG10_big_fil_rev_8_21_14_0_10_48_15]